MINEVYLIDNMEFMRSKPDNYYESGFDFEGCEIDEDYWNDQEKRFMEFKKKYHGEFYIPDENNLLFKDIK